MALRRTKILATLGPATDKSGVLERLFEAGVDVVRLNFSHGLPEMHIERAKAVRAQIRKTEHYVAILADLQGPKIRISSFLSNSVFLQEGQQFVLDVDLDENVGDQSQVGCEYKALPREVTPADVLLLDDGRVVLKVEKIDGARVVCNVIVGGKLSDSKGINKQGGGLSATALTEKDKDDIKTAVEIGADFVAVSFPRNAADIEEARRLLTEAGGTAGIIAKIERAEALDTLEEIISASDGIMIARGDLGVEIGDASLPSVQKHIIEQTRKMDKSVITATQMMESMTYGSLPTRAEVFDVANSVFDGTDAVMLSGESAVGKYPVKAVEAMHRVCLEAEKRRQTQTFERQKETRFGRTDEAIAKSTMFVANHFEIKAIVAYTESGSTPLWMSRVRSSIPIFAFTSNEKACRRVTLFRGVYPLIFDVNTTDHAHLNQEVINVLKRCQMVTNGDHVIITKGDLTGVQGGTNAMKIVKVGEGLVE